MTSLKKLTHSQVTTVYSGMRTQKLSSYADLPEGVWKDEPDKAVWVDPATGLDCMIRRNPGGALCGYVGISAAHRYHGKKYSECLTPGCVESYCYQAGHDNAERTLNVHGGLTYSAACQEDVPDGSCHAPEPGREKNIWWLGFDCAHAGDLCPGYMKYGQAFRGDTYATFEYVKGEVESLARQLAEIT